MWRCVGIGLGYEVAYSDFAYNEVSQYLWHPPRTVTSYLRGEPLRESDSRSPVVKSLNLA